jgi:hypothetical protein
MNLSLAGQREKRRDAHRRRPGFSVAAILAGALVAVAVTACGGPASAGQQPAGQQPAVWPGAVTDGPSGIPGNSPAPADNAVYTQRGSNLRVGWDSNETVLNTSDVNVKDFGRVAAFPVQGRIYSQPLFVPGLTIHGVTRNVVIVTTEDDQVYAFDADAAGSQPALLWHTSFLGHGATPVNDADTLHCTYITPNVGVTGTPVIDRATGTMYLVTVMMEGSHIVDSMHALSITTGHDVIAPVVLHASVRGTGAGSSHGILPFDPQIADQHAALLLDQGVVYVAFSGYCGRVPDHGWVLGYDASNLRQAVVWNDTPDDIDGGIWQAGMGLVANPAGDIYLTTGNGPFNLNTGGTDAGDSLLELHRDGSTLKIVDYFTPYYQDCMMLHDEDFSSGGPLMLPSEIIAVAKAGAFWVINRSDLGGYHTIPDPCQHLNEVHVDHIIQETPQQTINGGVWGALAYWNDGKDGFIYTAGIADHLKAWHLTDGKIVLPAASQAPETMAYPGAIPMGSSDGPDPGTGIVWAFDDENGAVLHAYAATDVARELWNSSQDKARDSIPRAGYDNFTLPTVAAGRVYLGTSGELLVYGLLH